RQHCCPTSRASSSGQRPCRSRVRIWKVACGGSIRCEPGGVGGKLGELEPSFLGPGGGRSVFAVALARRARANEHAERRHERRFVHSSAIYALGGATARAGISPERRSTTAPESIRRRGRTGAGSRLCRVASLQPAAVGACTA